ncbi:MAG TPA: hypothetical protein VGH15_14415 [Caulobacteraceae bacterium]|jgi:uncharacterized protein YcfJ
MKTLLALAATTLTLAPAATLPSPATARTYHSYGRFDPCLAAKTRAANNGAMTGAVLGAVVGGAMAGRGSHIKAAAAGGNTGAQAGQSIGAKSVKCLAYPRRYHARRACHWIEDDSDGAPRQFELCRGADGVWRASGRAA